MNVEVDDATAKFIEILSEEADRLVSNREDFVCVVLGGRPRLPGRSLGHEGSASARPAT